MSEENDFIIWQGGPCPVDLETVVEVKLSGGDVVRMQAGLFHWQRSSHAGNIIAYRVVEEEKPKIEIPEGFTPWAGGACPVDAKARVAFIMRAGDTNKIAPASFLRWNDAGLDDDIIAYRADKPRAHLPSARDIQVGGDHYKTPTVQPWDVVDTWPIEQQVGFHRGNVLKYVMRMGTKDENLSEIRKAAHYLQKLTEVLEKKGGL